MSTIKALLKEAKSLLINGKNEEAMEKCEAAIEDGVKDYMLYCYAALSNANQKYPVDASSHYQKALELDPEKPVAWQGYFKLYDSLGLQVDERAIQVAEMMANLAESPEKKDYALQKRREFLLQLRKFSELLKDPGNDQEFLIKTAKILLHRERKSQSEMDLLDVVLRKISCKITEDAELHFLFLKFKIDTAKTFTDWNEELIKFCKLHPEPQPNMVKRIEMLLHIQVLQNGSFCDELYEFYQASNDDDDSLVATLFACIKEEDWCAAADEIQKLSDVAICNASYGLSVVKILFEDDSLQKVVQVCTTLIARESDLAIKNLLKGYKATAMLYLGDKPMIEAALLLCPLKKRFALTEALLRAHNKETNYKPCLSFADKTRYDGDQLFRKNKLKEANEIMDKLKDSERWRDWLLIAEIQTALELPDAVPLLVKLGKHRRRCSKAFYLLAKNLRNRNSAKARACAERAYSLRPDVPEYVQLYDELLEETDADKAERIQVLKSLKTQFEWVHQRLYELYLSTGKIDEAILSIQYILRTRTDDANIWSLLGNAYLLRGSFQAAVNAFTKAEELKPDSDFDVLQMQVLLKLRHFDTVIEMCAKWREEKEQKSNSQSKLAISIIESQARFAQAKATYGAERIEHLSIISTLLEFILKVTPAISLPYKLAADVLVFISTLNESVLAKLKLPSFVVGSHTLADIWSTIISLLITVLNIDDSSPTAMADIGIALTKRGHLFNDDAMLDKAVLFLHRAILLCKNREQRSTFYTKLSDTLRIKNESFAKQQHVLCRALELHRANAEAWCRLALLYAKAGPSLHTEAKTAFEFALKIDAQCATTWTGYGLLANFDSTNPSHSPEVVAELKKTAQETLVQSLTYKPCKIATENLSDLILLKNSFFDASASRVDFAKVLALQETLYDDAPFLLRLAVLAEHFGYYEEAEQMYSISGISEEHKARVALFQGKQVSSSHSSLTLLIQISKLPTDELFDLLKKQLSEYSELFNKLEDGNGLIEDLRQAKLNIPLIIAAIITFDLPISKKTVTALHQIRPRHELVDYWPTEEDDELLNEFSYLEDDGETPFRLRHQYCKPLLNALIKLREKWLESRPPPAKISSIDEILKESFELPEPVNEPAV